MEKKINKMYINLKDLHNIMEEKSFVFSSELDKEIHKIGVKNSEGNHPFVGLLCIYPLDIYVFINY